MMQVYAKSIDGPMPIRNDRVLRRVRQAPRDIAKQAVDELFPTESLQSGEDKSLT